MGAEFSFLSATGLLHSRSFSGILVRQIVGSDETGIPWDLVHRKTMRCRHDVSSATPNRKDQQTFVLILDVCGRSATSSIAPKVEARAALHVGSFKETSTFEGEEAEDLKFGSGGRSTQSMNSITLELIQALT